MALGPKSVDVASLPGRIRHRFPVFGQRVYVNSCSQGALSDSVRDAYGQYLDDWDELGALKSANQYTVGNIMQRLSRLKKDPWAGIGRVRQALPKLK